MSEQDLEFETVGDGVAALDSEPSEVTDEDNLDADPLEDGMDPGEDYSRDMKMGGVDAEEQDRLAYRIPQEQPDPALEEVDEDPGRPIADTPIDDLDESIDAPEHAVDGVGGVAVLDPLAGDGETEAEGLTDGDGEIELGLSSAEGAAEPTGLPTDDGVGAAAGMDDERATEGAEQQALRIEQER